VSGFAAWRRLVKQGNNGNAGGRHRRRPRHQEQTMNAHNVRTRIAALLAAMATTALFVGSQLVVAGHYTAEADAALAAKQMPSTQPVGA
jgi:hypothetical protein